MNQRKFDIREIAESSLRGEATSEEMALLTNWVISDRHLNEWVAEEMSSMSPDVKDVDLEPICRSITGGRGKWKTVLKHAVTAVAACAVGFGACFYAMKNFDHKDTAYPFTVRTLEGEKSRVTLPDGSYVTINSMSHLSYLYDEERGVRNVELRGEAWFDVKSDEEHPFIVDCDNLKVECLGTEFNVTSYPDDESVTVVLKDGRINAVSMRDRVELHPGMKLRYDRSTGSVDTEMVEASDYCNWKRGEIHCNNITVEELFRRMSRTYGVSINIETPGMRTEKVYGMMLEGDLRHGMDIVCKACNAQYRFENDSTLSVYKLEDN